MTTVEHEMTEFSHLTNDELINQTTLRDDLTMLEHELLDRFIAAMDALAGLHNSGIDTLTRELL